MGKKQVYLWFPFVCLAMTAGGCTVALVALGVGAGAGTAMYVAGDLEAVVSEDIATVYDAALKALDQLEVKVSSKVRDALSARIVARDASDKKVTIKLTSTAEGTTKLSIRIGTFGDETKSRLIYGQIQENLDSGTADANRSSG